MSIILVVLHAMAVVLVFVGKGIFLNVILYCNGGETEKCQVKEYSRKRSK